MTDLDELVRETLVFTAQKAWRRTGPEFFDALVAFVGERLGVEYVLVDELLPGENRARTVGLYVKGRVAPPVEYDLHGTPCENVMGKSLCFYPSDIQRRFPDDSLLREMGAESYIGIPLWDSRGEALGLIAAMGQRPMFDREPAQSILQVVAVRCAHELERQRQDRERSRVQAQLLRYQKLESLGELSAGIAHDMNNVLAAIIGTGTVLRNRPELEAAYADLDLLLAAATRGKRLVQGLTDFARSKLDDATPLDLNALIRQEAEILQRTTLKRIEVQLNLEEPLPWVLGEASTLSSVFMNLCLNAVDAMPRGGRLRLASASMPDGRVEVRVEDTGCGMAPDVLSRALDPFFTTKPIGKGTGLGLSIAYGAMKAHGGSIELHSEPGRGTSVTLTFPATSKQPPQPEPRGASEGFQVSSARVLLVDDEDMVRRSLSALLTFQGHTVHVACGGAEALETLRQDVPVDVVVLDQNMPGLTGTETLRRIRERFATLPVILCSGAPERAVIDAAARDPRVTLLDKPFDLAQLRTAIGTAVAPR